MNNRSKTFKQLLIVFGFFLIGGVSSILVSNGWTALGLFVVTVFFGVVPFLIVSAIVIVLNKGINPLIYTWLLILAGLYFVVSFFQVGDGGVHDKDSLIFLRRWYRLGAPSYDRIQMLRGAFMCLSVMCIVVATGLLVASMVMKDKNLSS